MKSNKTIVSLIILFLTVARIANAQVPREATFVTAPVIQTYGAVVTNKGADCLLTLSWAVASKVAPNLTDTQVSQIRDNCKALEQRGLVKQVAGNWQPTEEAKAIWSRGPEAVGAAVPSAAK